MPFSLVLLSRPFVTCAAFDANDKSNANVTEARSVSRRVNQTTPKAFGKEIETKKWPVLSLVQTNEVIAGLFTVHADINLRRAKDKPFTYSGGESGVVMAAQLQLLPL